MYITTEMIDVAQAPVPKVEQVKRKKVTPQNEYATLPFNQSTVAEKSYVSTVRHFED